MPTDDGHLDGWHHYSFTWSAESGNMTAYLDGEAVQTSSDFKTDTPIAGTFDDDGLPTFHLGFLAFYDADLALSCDSEEYETTRGTAIAMIFRSLRGLTVFA